MSTNISLKLLLIHFAYPQNQYILNFGVHDFVIKLAYTYKIEELKVTGHQKFSIF